MSTPTQPANDPERPPPGRNRISSLALTTLTQATAAAELGVQPAAVRVRFDDDAGALAISVASPIASPGLDRVARTGLGAGQLTLVQRCITAKGAILRNVGRLSGMRIARVDIRLTSVTFPGAKAVVDQPAAGPEEPRRRVI